MCVIAVKGPVNKLNLGDLFLKEKTQLSFYPVHTAQPHGPVDGRKAIAAAVRTAPGGFVVNDPVIKLFQIPVEKRERVQIQFLPPWRSSPS